jgi:hypothetical protein
MIIVESLIVIGLVVTHSVVGYIGFKIAKKFSKKETK